MSQIHLHHSQAAGTGSALSGLGGASSGTRKEAAQGQGAQAFSQLLSQSSQHMRAQAPQPQALTQPQAFSQPAPQTAAKPAAPARPPAPAAQTPGASSSAQDENKLAARNAASRSAANKQAEAPKAPARQPQADGTDKAHRQDGAKAHKGGDGADKADRADGTPGAVTEEEAAQAASRTDGTDPSAAAQQMLAMLRGEAPQEARLSLKDGGPQADGEEPGASVVSGHGKGGRHAAGTDERAQLQEDLQQAAQAAMDGKAAAEGEAAEGLQAVTGGAQELALGEHKAAGPHQSFESMLAAAQQADAPGGTSGPDQTGRTEAPAVPLSQPLDSPEFAPELSASVSLLIKDGIHEAQLQLNPTDMGPVAIQIQVDGQQAQVNFHAEQAATRDVLMRSMPDLAAALQSQGLTLSGGGVFAQAQSGNGQGGRDGEGDGGSRRGGRGGQGDDGPAGISRSERRSQPRGLVDVYA